MATVTPTGPLDLGRTLVAWFIVLAFAAVTLLGWLSLERASNADPMVVVVLWFNAIVILLALGFEIGRRPYSLHVMHLVAMFLFLGASSLFQYSRGYLGVPGSIVGMDRHILPAALAPTLWLAGYLVAYEGRRFIGGPVRGGLIERPLTSNRVMLLGLFAIVGLAYLGVAGLIGVTTRGAAEANLQDFARDLAIGTGATAYGRTFYILTYNLARALPCVALLSALLLVAADRRKRTSVMYLLIAVLGVGTMIVNNPFAASRMFLTSTLIALMAPFVLMRFRTAWLLVIGISAGLAILPGIGNTRNSLDFDEALDYLQLVSPIDYLALNSDVDSLGMTVLCQQWIDQFGLTWGRQLLGGILFWVPRAIWRDKPIATGAMVTEDLGFDFTNLAPPITAEALINFGLPGTFLFGIAFGLILARLDAIYWSPSRPTGPGERRIIDAIYPFLLVCITFFTRGDLLASMTFTVSYVAWIVPLGFALRRFTPKTSSGSTASSSTDPPSGIQGWDAGFRVG